jgi:hypothetical protein
MIKRGDIVRTWRQQIIVWSDIAPSTDLHSISTFDDKQIAMVIDGAMTNNNGTPKKMIKILTQKGIVGWVFEQCLVAT